jgi:hypothetical protein
MDYIISVAELHDLCRDMIKDGMDYVSVSLHEPDPDEDFPGGVHFEAFKRSVAFDRVDYETLEIITP